MLGVNDRVALAQVRGLAQQAIHERHMRAGVTIVDPAATVIDVDVEIGQDTMIEPFTTIRGSDEDRRGCADQAFLPRRLRARGRRRASGPFAYLRPGRSCARARRRGRSWRSRTPTSARGAKVPHLSYIGDADVGEGTNLGASTITANYDGRNKHRTTIGREVRSSVDTYRSSRR